MTPFDSTGGPQIPPAPIDIPTPDIPVADFTEVGKQVASGAKQAGFWQGLWDGLLDLIPSILKTIVGFIFGMFGVVVAWILQQFAAVRKGGEAGVMDAAAQTVADLFGVSINAGMILPGGSEAQRAEYGKAIAQAILKGIGAGAPAGGGTTIEPGSEGALQFLSTAVNLSVEGWLEGFFMELVSAGQLETFAELKDIISRTLGLGRLAHRAMSAPIRAFVEEPYTWLINQAYRPTLLSADVMCRAYLRGALTREQLDHDMAYLGYSTDRITSYINYARIHVSPSILAELVEFGNLQEADAVAEIKAAGYDDATANLALNYYRNLRPTELLRTYVSTAISAYRANKIDQVTVEGIINNSGLPDKEKAIYTQLASLADAERGRDVSVSEARQLVEAGIWSLDQFRALLLKLGYSPSDELDLELLLLGQIKSKSDAAHKKAEAAAAKAAADSAKQQAADLKAQQAAALAQFKGINTATFEALVIAGLKTVADYRAYLTAEQIPAANIDALAALLQQKLVKAQQAAGIKTATAPQLASKNLSEAQLATAVKDGVITIDEYAARLAQAGLSQADIQILTSTLQDSINAAKQTAGVTSAAQAVAAQKGLNLAQFQLAVREGLKTLDDYTAWLQANGYSSDAVVTLGAELGAQLAKDKAAQAAVPAADAAAAQKGLNLAQLEAAVRAGIKTVADYQAALQQLNYAPDAIAALVGLLQLKIQTDQATAAANSTAAKALGKLGLSLADLERAVKIGVVPLTTLTDAMVRANVNTDDAQLVTLYVSAEAAAAAAAKAKGDTAAALVAAAGFSLLKLESDAVAGKLTSAQLQQTLAAAGVSADDQQAILGLVGDELANAAYAAAQETAAASLAAAKGLNLAQFKAAVKEGVKTLDDYNQFLIGLGYDAAAADVLTATLAAQLQAAAPAAA
jgi:hypothetical protein